MKKLIVFLLMILACPAWAIPPMPGGDMYKSVYDTNNDGVVDSAASSTVATTITAADNQTDTTEFLVVVGAATGNLGPRTRSTLTYNAATGLLSSTLFGGALNGTVGATTPAAGAFTTITGTGNLTLDDGDGASPAMHFIDATNEDVYFYKADASYFTLYVSDTNGGLYVAGGNFLVGNIVSDPPTQTLDGNDAYVSGNVEIKGQIWGGAGGFNVDADGDATFKSVSVTRGNWAGYQILYEPTLAGDDYWKNKTSDNMTGSVVNIFPSDTGAVGQHLVISDLSTDNQTNGYAYSNTIRITQNTHGFAVGDVVKRSGSAYAKAQADSAANAEVVGIVSAVPTANTFDLTSHGYITGLTSLTDGTLYYLSPSSAGALTATQPSTTGQVIKPLLVATATTAGYFNNMRGTMVSVSGAPFVQTDNATTVACGGYYISSTNKVFQLPTPSSGCEVCVKNIQGGTNTINLSVGTGIYLEETDGSAYCTATYNLISGGANGDQICVVGLDATHWTTWSYKGTWTCTDNAS